MHRIPTFACTIGVPRIAEVTYHRMRCSSFVGKAERQWARDIDGLSRGYVSKSRHGAPQFQDPRLARLLFNRIVDAVLLAMVRATSAARQSRGSARLVLRLRLGQCQE